MTTAHDSTPGPSPLDESTVHSVRTALIHYVTMPTRGDSLRSALHSMAAEARAKSIMPEHLLVALKDVWYSLPTVQGIGEQAEQVRLLQRVVTMCIKEYYSGHETA